MQRLENDMDELFQKAAENYPLRTNESDWDKIASRLPNSPDVSKSPARPASNRKKYLSVAILLLIALLVSDIIIRTRDKGDTNKETDNLRKNIVNKKETGISTKAINNINESYSNQQVESPGIIPEKNISPGKTLFNVFSASELYSMEIDLTTPSVNNFTDREIVTRFAQVQFDDIKTPAIDIAKFSLKERESIPVSIFNKKIDPYKKKEHNFYWGILAGPQFNEVKQQGIKKSGFGIGIPIGYRMNKKFAVESGIYYSSKQYYSSGEHFTMSKPDPSMPANMILMDLQGKSNLLELPLKLRYDFVNDQKNKFFISSGLSSYVMTKENNNYHTMVNGTENYMNRSYKKTTIYPAASFNFSAGIEHRLSKKNSIRIEPYLQIPIKGIGVGAMPVTSAGIHIGIITGNKNP